ncbi:hypothetical protein [Arthrobacter sp. 24S4-2]|nr:hypothetical protein [Arthrobacter sp. 24S4-2]
MHAGAERRAIAVGHRVGVGVGTADARRRRPWQHAGRGPGALDAPHVNTH